MGKTEAQRREVSGRNQIELRALTLESKALRSFSLLGWRARKLGNDHGLEAGHGLGGSPGLGKQLFLPLAVLELVCTLSPGAERGITLLFHHLVMKKNCKPIRHKLSEGADGYGPYDPERVCGVRSKDRC